MRVPKETDEWPSRVRAKACMCSGFSDESSDVGYKYWGRRNKARKAECNQIQKGFECQDEDLDLALCAVGLGGGSVTQQEGITMSIVGRKAERGMNPEVSVGRHLLKSSVATVA